MFPLRSFSVALLFAASLTSITADQKRRIEVLTTVFENSRAEFQYGYIEDLHDGRGYTAGRIGFCTGTGDLLEVVERYTALQPGNPLAAYLPELRRLATSASDRTSGLPGFERNWKRAATDPSFRTSQDEEVEQSYFLPALEVAKSVGAETALSKGFLYDTLVQHGNGDDPDGLPALLLRAEHAAGGTPKSGVTEQIWLSTLMDQRLSTLLNATDPDTRAAWAESVDRVHAYRSILISGNWNLDGPIHVRVYGDFDGWIP